MLLFEGGWAVTKACQAWESFLQSKLLNGSDALSPSALYALKEIFLTCHVTSRMAAEDNIIDYKTPRNFGTGDESDVIELIDASSILLSANDIADQSTGNLLYLFFKTLRERGKLGKDDTLDIIDQYGCGDGKDVSGHKSLHFQGFLQYVKDNAKSDKRIVWKALHACGYDFNYKRSVPLFQESKA